MLQVVISGTSILTTAYAGVLEVAISSTARITKTYYSAGSQLIALRVATSTAQSTLYFLISDHLGSASLTTNASGSFVARQLYDAWGNVRSGGGLPTDIGYTGQRLDSGTNLLFMHARYYDSQIGRWSSPDSIIPDESNPQSLNRYSYVENGPLNHADPTGHMMTYSEGPGMVGGCGEDPNNFTPGQTQALAKQKYYTYYRPCQEHGGPDCSGLATAIMNTADAIESLGKTVDKLTNSGIGSQFTVCGGGGLGAGGQGCLTGSFLLNLRSGQFGIYYTVSAGGRVGTPNGLQISAGPGAVVAPGVSDLRSLLEAEEYHGVDANIGIFGQAGYSVQRSQSLQRYDSDLDGVDDAFRPTVDKMTDMPVTTWSISQQVGVNQIPTGVEGSVQAGASFSWGCVFTAFSGVYCIQQ